MTEYLLKSDVMAQAATWDAWYINELNALPTHTFPAPSLAGWHDISSAPRDGTKIILARFTNSSDRHNNMIAVDYYRRTQDNQSFIGWGKFNEKHWPPTHWMPLPPAPSVPAPESGNSKLLEMIDTVQCLVGQRELFREIARLLAERGDK